jgi:hypothetical protein
MSGVEDAARDICASYSMLELYEGELLPTARSQMPLSDEVDRHLNRLGSLVRSLGRDVRALSIAVWGDARLVDDLYSCRPDEPEQESDAA